MATRYALSPDAKASVLAITVPDGRLVAVTAKGLNVTDAVLAAALDRHPQVVAVESADSEGSAPKRTASKSRRASKPKSTQTKTNAPAAQES